MKSNAALFEALKKYARHDLKNPDPNRGTSYNSKRNYIVKKKK